MYKPMEQVRVAAFLYIGALLTTSKALPLVILLSMRA
jgi:hypothetical protein